ncbi:MAG: hypothetical protein QOE89_167, partial [Pseudonocardiales bacterium]|nr:hypothetical protein [Pseudonocardiales bacterium]
MKLPAWLTRHRMAQLASVLVPLGACAAVAPFRHSFANTDAALLLMAVVVAIAALGNRLAGIVAAVSSAVWFDFFLTAPYQRFSITSRTDIETTLLLLAV